MRTSLNEIMQIEKYLTGNLPISERLLFEARLLTSPLLRSNVWFQKQLLNLVRLYHRKGIRSAVEKYHKDVFSQPRHAEFQKRTAQLFQPEKL